MNFSLKKLALYEIKPDYIDFLKKYETNISENFHDYYKNTFKGFIVSNGTAEYFIPLIPAKKDQRNWNKKHFSGKFLISEPIKKDELRKYAVYKKTSNPEIVLDLLSVIDVSKLFPIPENVYSEINIEKIRHKHTKHCFNKSLEYFEENEEKILSKVNDVYLDSQNPHKSHYYGQRYCNITFIEKQMLEYSNNKKN